MQRGQCRFGWVRWEKSCSERVWAWLAGVDLGSPAELTALGWAGVLETWHVLVYLRG